MDTNSYNSTSFITASWKRLSENVMLKWQSNGFPVTEYGQSPYGPGFRSLRSGKLYMDMPEGYEITYDYRILDGARADGEEIIVPGGTIESFYKAVPVKDPKSPADQYTYVKNDTENIPVVPDFPQNYSWQDHKEDPIMVTSVIAARSLKAGKTTSWESQISWVTHLDKEEPDCYFLIPTDLEPYTVKPGDTLCKISKQYYGTSKNWDLIFKRNNDVVKQADKIYPGELLIIPNAKSWGR